MGGLSPTFTENHGKILMVIEYEQPIDRNAEEEQ